MFRLIERLPFCAKGAAARARACVCVRERLNRKRELRDSSTMSAQVSETHTRGRAHVLLHFYAHTVSVPSDADVVEAGLAAGSCCRGGDRGGWDGEKPLSRGPQQAD